MDSIISLRERLEYDIKEAMRSRQQEKLTTLRLLMSAIKQREIDERIKLTDSDIVAVFDKLAKQRRESIECFQKAHRQDLVVKEEVELDLILTYMPKAFSQDEIQILVEKAIAETTATLPQDIGKVMAILKPQLQGRADLSKVSLLVKQLLA